MHLVKTIKLPNFLISVGLATETAAPKFSAEELETARREGYQRGFEDASAVIEAQLVEQREEVLHLQQKTFQAVMRHSEALTQQVANVVPELTMEIVGRVLAGMQPDAETVRKIVEEVISQITPGPETVSVSLSARDLELIGNYEAGFREQYPQIEFRLNAELKAGDCVVMSRFGELDGRIATKLRSIDRMME
jgi:flagellar biosynthesis/type III secretory pathway protein FliH